MTDYLDKYLDDLYRLRVNFKTVAERERVSRSKVGVDFRKRGLISPWIYYGLIDTGINELDEKLKQKYNSIVTRCNGRNNNKYHTVYHGMEYLPIYEWVELCNESLEQLSEMWDKYVLSGRQYKDTISVDRINNDEGYSKDNLRFVPLGFNAWRRNINPVKVTYKNEVDYFMTCEEASEHYDLRRQTIGDLLRGQYREVSDDYTVESTDVSTALTKNNKPDILSYYKRGR